MSINQGHIQSNRILIQNNTSMNPSMSSSESKIIDSSIGSKISNKRKKLDHISTLHKDRIQKSSRLGFTEAVPLKALPQDLFGKPPGRIEYENMLSSGSSTMLPSHSVTSLPKVVVPKMVDQTKFAGIPKIISTNNNYSSKSNNSDNNSNRSSLLLGNDINNAAVRANLIAQPQVPLQPQLQPQPSNTNPYALVYHRGVNDVPNNQNNSSHNSSHNFNTNNTSNQPMVRPYSQSQNNMTPSMNNNPMLMSMNQPNNMTPSMNNNPMSMNAHQQQPSIHQHQMNQSNHSMQYQPQQYQPQQQQPIQHMQQQQQHFHQPPQQYQNQQHQQQQHHQQQQNSVPYNSNYFMSPHQNFPNH